MYSIFYTSKDGSEHYHCDCSDYKESQRIARDLLEFSENINSWVELKENRKPKFSLVVRK